MNNTNGALSFDATIANSQFNATIDDMSRRIRGLTNTAATETTKINDVFSKLATVAGGAFAFTQLASLPQKLIQVRGEFQQLEIAFETMLGSKSKSDALFADVVKLAATTPFGLKDAGMATKQLLAYGSASTEVIGELRMLGDVASGVSVPIGDLTYLYGTLKTQGRAYAVDIRQFAGRGIPIYAELAKVLGVNKDKVAEFVEAGKVGFPQVQKAFQNMTGEGGMFFNLMEKQSKSLTGLTSQLKDAIDIMFNNIGKSQEGALASSILFATSVVQNYEPILDVLKVLVATYGAYKAAIIATAAVQAIAASVGPVKLFLELAGSIKSAADAQALFNLVTGLNPYVVAGAALVGLITAVALFRDTTTEAEKAQSRMADVNNTVSQSLAGEQAKIQVLTAQIKNESVSREIRNNKLKELISLQPQMLSGLTLENIATAEGTKAINNYIEARKRQIETDNLKNELDQSIQRQLEAKSGKKDTGIVSTLIGAATTAGNAVGSAISGVDFSKIHAANVKAANTEIIKSEGELQKKILERVTALQTADEAIANSGKSTGDVIKKDVKYYDELIKAKKLSQESTTNNTDFKALEADIKDLEAKKARITGAISKESKAATKAAEKEADKSGPMGSVAYWDYIVSKQKELVDKIPVSDTSQLNKQMAILADAEKNAANARKKISVLSFDEELEEKKKNYQAYQLWVDNLGSKAANDQFDGLITQGKSYAEYLKQQIDQFQSVSPESLTGQEQEKLVKLRFEYDDATGADTKLEKFQKRLDGIRQSATSLTDEIQMLDKAQAELDPNDQSPEAIAKKIALQSQKNDAYKERKSQLQQYLVAVAGTEERRLAIESKYNDLGVELAKKYGEDRGAAYQAASKALAKDKKEEFDADNSTLVNQSKEFKALTRVISEATEDQTQIKLDAAKKQLALLKSKNLEETEEYKDQLYRITQIEKEKAAQRRATYDALGQSLASLGEALSGIDGILGNAGALLASIGSGIGSVSKAIDKFNANKKAGGSIGFDQYASAAQGAVQLINLAINSARERKKAETEYFNSVIAQQKQYNQLKVEALGLDYQAGDNVFVEDKVAKITSGIAQLNAAQTEYEKSLDALENGRAKTGQRDKVDWGKVGSGALTGAAAGAALGPIGAAVGGAIGAIVGLFAGKKKKDQYAGLLEVFPELIDQAGTFNKALAETLIANNSVDDATKVLLQDTIAWTEQIEAAKEQINSVIADLAGSLGDDLQSALVGAFENGTSAAEAFSGSVSKILRDMISQLLFTQMFSKDFEKLQKDMQASYELGGDQNSVDDIIRFYEAIGQKGQDYVDALAVAQAEGEKYGLDIFNKDAKSTTQSSLSGAIQGMSQQTAGVLEGQFNALRITSAESLVIHRDSNMVLRTQLLRLTEISYNTSFLLSIDKKLDKLNLLDANYNRAYGG